MTKQEFINLILTRINGGSFTLDAWKKAHPKIIQSYVELALNGVFIKLFKDEGNYDLYCRWYEDIDVTQGIMGLFESELPVDVLQNNLKGNSVKRIVPIGDWKSYTFMPSVSTEAASISRLGTTVRNSVVPYSVTDNKVMYYKKNLQVEKVNILMIKPVSEYDKDDSLPIPAGSEEYVLTFVLKFLETQKPDELAVNANPDA